MCYVRSRASNGCERHCVHACGCTVWTEWAKITHFATRQMANGVYCITQATIYYNMVYKHGWQHASSHMQTRARGYQNTHNIYQIIECHALCNINEQVQTCLRRLKNYFVAFCSIIQLHNRNPQGNMWDMLTDVLCSHAVRASCTKLSVRFISFIYKTKCRRRTSTRMATTLRPSLTVYKNHLSIRCRWHERTR